MSKDLMVPSAKNAVVPRETSAATPEDELWTEKAFVLGDTSAGALDDGLWTEMPEATNTVTPEDELRTENALVPRDTNAVAMEDDMQGVYDDLVVLADSQTQGTDATERLVGRLQSLANRLAREKQQRVQAYQLVNQLQNTYTIAERPEWTVVWNAICATVERRCQARPWLTRSGAFQRIENALKWEYRHVLTPPSRVAMLPTLPVPGESAASSGQAYRRLRLRNLPLMRWKEAIAFLEALPPPDADHLSVVRSDPVYDVSERAWGPAEGEGLRRVRLTCALSVRDVAARIFFAPSTIRHWEVGKRTPSAEAWARLPAAFGVSPETLARWCGGFRGQS